jgi:hypothetical protein
MRITMITCILLGLVACAGGQAPASPTISMTPVQGTPQPRIPAELPTVPAVQPPATRAGASGVLITLRRPIEDTSYFPQRPFNQLYRDETHLVDPATGVDVPGYPPFVAQAVVTSGDGKRAVGIESRGQSCEANGGGSACYASADVLHLIDLSAWHEVTSTLSATGWVGPLVFSPDSTRLALSLQEKRASTLMVLDARTGQVLNRRALSFRPSQIKYTSDGAQLAIYGQPLSSDPGMTQPDPPRVLWVDAATLDPKWEQPLTNILSGSWCLENCQSSHEQLVNQLWLPAFVFAPDGRKLYIAHADAERLTSVDFGARTLRSVDVRVERSWWEQWFDFRGRVAEAKGITHGAYKSAVLSPDGQRLYVVGRAYTSTDNSFGEPRDLQMVDVESGHVLASQKSEAVSIALSPNGAYLWLEAPGKSSLWTEVLDAHALTLVKRFEEGWHIAGTRSTNGQPLIVAAQYSGHQTAVLDPHTYEFIHSWTADGYASWAAVH